MLSDFDNMNIWNINFYYIFFKIFFFSIYVVSGDKYLYVKLLNSYLL